MDNFDRDLTTDKILWDTKGERPTWAAHEPIKHIKEPLVKRPTVNHTDYFEENMELLTHLIEKDRK